MDIDHGFEEPNAWAEATDFAEGDEGIQIVDHGEEHAALMERVRRMKAQCRELTDLVAAGAIPQADIDFLETVNIEVLKAAVATNSTQEMFRIIQAITRRYVAHFTGSDEVAKRHVSDNYQSFQSKYSEFAAKPTKQHLCDCGGHIFKPLPTRKRQDYIPETCPKCHVACDKLEKKWMWYGWPLRERIQDLFMHPYTAKLVQSHARYEKPTGDRSKIVETLWGSKGYQERKEEHAWFFRESRNIILLMNADGASVCQDDSKQCFPILCEILNFPPHIRIKYDNLLWFGMCSGKPKPEILFTKFVEELIDLWENGVLVWDASNGEIFRCHVMLYGIVMDYKGLTEVMRHMDVGAYLACVKCSLIGRYATWLKRMVYSTSAHEALYGHPARVLDEDLVRYILDNNESKCTAMRAIMGVTQYEKYEKALFRQTGWKFNTVFRRLPYFKITRDFWLDPMHFFMNLARRAHGLLLGDGYDERFRKQARVFKEHKTWWMGKPNFMSPAAVPSVQLPRQGNGKFTKCDVFEKTKKWVNEHMQPPKNWGPLNKKLLGRTSKGAPKAVRGHDSLVLWQSGIFSLVANSDGPSPEEERKRAPFAMIMGNLSEIVRVLTHVVVDHEELPKLKALVDKTVADAEKNLSYHFLTINCHLLRHLVDQLAENGPLVEQWMFALEGAFGLNKLARKNPAALVGSIVMMLGRMILLKRLLGMRAHVMRVNVDVDRLPLLPAKVVLPEGKSTTLMLTEHERDIIHQWMDTQDVFKPHRVFRARYAAYCEEWVRWNNNLRAHARSVHGRVPPIIPPPSIWSSTWQGRPLTEEEMVWVDGLPETCLTYKKCFVGRDMFRIRSADEHRKSRHCFMKMNDVAVGTHVVDFYGSVETIFAIDFPGGVGEIILFEGKFFNNVRADDRAKVFLYNENGSVVPMRQRRLPGGRGGRGGRGRGRGATHGAGRGRGRRARQDALEVADILGHTNDSPVLEAKSVSGQIFVAPHPTREGVQVIFDRSADFLECEDSENEEEATPTNAELQAEPLEHNPADVNGEGNGEGSAEESNSDTQSSADDEDDSDGSSDSSDGT